MPAQYEKIRDSYLSRGYPEKEAKHIAAATYNKQHPGNPVGPHSDDQKRQSSPPHWHPRQRRYPRH
jgi:hypothetical protein